MQVQRLVAGLYEAENGDRIEQDTEGYWGATTDWWIHRESGSTLDGPFRTLRDAKQAL